MLEQSKAELEHASSEIGKLKKELELQQKYYEKQLQLAGASGITEEVRQHVSDQVNQTSNYNLDKALENREALIKKQEAELSNLRDQLATSDRMVEVLKNELKLQSEHYETAAKS